MKEIIKSFKDSAFAPNLKDYEKEYQEFSWAQLQQDITGLPNERGLNIAFEAVDRHAEGERKDHIALRWLSKKGEKLDFTFLDLKEESNRFANILQQLGIGKGDRVFTLSGRLPALYFTALGTLKNTSVFCPLFSAFGPEPIFQRIHKGDGKVLVTTKLLYKQKVAKLKERLPQLKYILLMDVEEDLTENVLSLPKLMKSAAKEFTIPPTNSEDMSVLHFTSGTTGMPKGAIHVHQAALIHYITGKYVLDLHPEDVFWCTADPGWVTGTSYGIFAPLLHGATNIIDEADFDAKRWCTILAEEKVTIWYTAPTAIRRLMRLGIKPKQDYELACLRLIHSVGEPLNPEAVLWGEEAFGLPIHDNWWQSETGGIMIANYLAMNIRPGSMGRPLPGIEAAIVKRHNENKITLQTEPDVVGDLALKVDWPSMFRGYLHDKERYEKCFREGWYITGDLAKKDSAGYFWFVGRADDIIKTSGHMVGPFEVENVLMEHPAVAEAGVIGKPDPLIGELVKAFVSLKEGFEANEALQLELIGFARKKLGSAVAPKQIEFQENLPKTRSGKIMRRLLKARELGLPEGDVSTLEVQ